MTFSFCGWLFCNVFGRLYSVPYIFPVVLNHIFFMGSVILLFESDKEKRVLAAAMLPMIVMTVMDFGSSFLTCLVLFLRHTVKGIPEPFLNGWEIGLNRIYLEQEKSGRYHSQIAVYKMLAEQYSQSERLRHDIETSESREEDTGTDTNAASAVKEPVTYTKTGETVSAEQSTSISVSI